MSDVRMGKSYSDLMGEQDFRIGREYVSQQISVTNTSAVTRTFVNPSSTLIFWVTSGTWEIKKLSVYDKTDGKAVGDMYAITLNPGDTLSIDSRVVEISFTCTDASVSSPGVIDYYADGVASLET